MSLPTQLFLCVFDCELFCVCVWLCSSVCVFDCTPVCVYSLFLVADTLLCQSIRWSHFLTASGFRITAPAQLSATGVLCIQPSSYWEHHRDSYWEKYQLLLQIHVKVKLLDQNGWKFNLNKWRRVTISLRMGGQGHPTPCLTPPQSLTPLPHTHIHSITTAAAKMHVFRVFNSSVADRWTNGRTKPLRVACPQLKIWNKISCLFM